MEWWQMYLFTRLEAISCVVDPVAIIASIIALCTWVGYKISKTHYDIAVLKERSYDTQEWGNWVGVWNFCLKLSFPTAIIAIVLFLAVPTQKEMAAIYLVPKVTHSNAAKELEALPADVAKLLRLKTEQYINDIAPKK